MRSGWDVLVAGLLGADEFGFSTAPLIGRRQVALRRLSLLRDSGVKFFVCSFDPSYEDDPGPKTF
jgi:hypothetical protein